MASFLHFLRQYTVFAKDVSVTTNALKPAYRAYCQNNGCETVNDEEWSAGLRFRECQAWWVPAQGWTWKGVRLKVE
jgi:hypothetical protein